LVIGERLRAWREYKALSQDDLEGRLGLTRYYISRVANGFTIPKLENFERFALALEVPVSQLVHEEEDPYPPPNLPASKKCRGGLRGVVQKNLRLLERFNLLFGQILDRDRRVARRFSSQNDKKDESLVPGGGKV